MITVNENTFIKNDSVIQFSCNQSLSQFEFWKKSMLLLFLAVLTFAKIIQFTWNMIKNSISMSLILPRTNQFQKVQQSYNEELIMKLYI